MSGGDIAGLIAAVAFLILVGFLAVPLLKLGKVLDEVKVTVHDVTDGVAPLIEEATQSIVEANKQLARVDKITTNVASITGNVSGVVSSFTSAIASPLAKFAGLFAAFSGKKPKKK